MAAFILMNMSNGLFLFLSSYCAFLSQQERLF